MGRRRAHAGLTAAPKWRRRALAGLFSFHLAAAAADGVLAQASPDEGAARTTMIGRSGALLRKALARLDTPEAESAASREYALFAARIARDYGITWSAEVSLLEQWGRPDGGSPALQLLATPSLDWSLFERAGIGSGSLQLVYSAAGYPTAQDAEAIQSRLGTITPINDYPARQLIFSQLSYTHAFADKRWRVGAGQFPISNFDDNAFLNDQQHNFVNYALSQNGSATYPLGGLGAWVQWTPVANLELAAGAQNPVNTQAQTLSGKGFGHYGAASFGYAQWTPRRSEGSQYSALYYDVPAVPAQGATRGWSVNAVQALGRGWSAFGRANRAYGATTAVRASYVAGAALDDPLHRAAGDQLAVAFAFSQPAPAPVTPPGARNEKIVEAYWSWTLVRRLVVTPDVQLIVDPALGTRSSVWVLSLRTTLEF